MCASRGPELGIQPQELSPGRHGGLFKTQVQTGELRDRMLALQRASSVGWWGIERWRHSASHRATSVVNFLESYGGSGKAGGRARRQTCGSVYLEATLRLPRLCWMCRAGLDCKIEAFLSLACRGLVELGAGRRDQGPEPRRHWLPPAGWQRQRLPHAPACSKLSAPASP